LGLCGFPSKATELSFEGRNTLTINEQDVGALVADAFPAVKDELQRAVVTFGNGGDWVGLYTLFGQIIDPLILQPLMTDDRIDDEGLKRFFDTFEILVREGNANVKTFIKDEVCEELIANPSWWLRRVDDYIGPELVIACQESQISLEETRARYLRGQRDSD
jgi:hypothetical protein